MEMTGSLLAFLLDAHRSMAGRLPVDFLPERTKESLQEEHQGDLRQRSMWMDCREIPEY